MLATSSFNTILDAVRDLVLDWAIALEKAGVRGEKLSFSQAEQHAAQAAHTVYNIEHIGAFTGVMGSGNTAGDITSSTIDIERADKFVSQVKASSKALIEEGVGEADLRACLSLLEGALKKADQSGLRSALHALREIVVKTSTGLVSTGILTILHQLLGTGAAP